MRLVKFTILFLMKLAETVLITLFKQKAPVKTRAFICIKSILIMREIYLNVNLHC